MIKQPLNIPLPGDRYILVKKYRYRVLGSKPIEIKVGFTYTGASAPRILWPLVRPDGLIRAAALVHDFLYRFPRERTRKEIDNLFLTMMIESEMSKWKARIIYYAVRLFGKSSFAG